ncbi:MAG: glycosyltransferase [Ardenticatenaceae bacterium]|nr:glycosyltransferase [Ardenticatenaceae bacterium]
MAIIGIRGVPASYSGLETCAEQLGTRLAARGHRVSVYCRQHHKQYSSDWYQGIRLITLPTVHQKYLDTIVHTLLAAGHALLQPYDIVLGFTAGNSPVAWLPALGGKQVVLNVDGLDWRRRKWPSPAKRYIQFAERLATRLPYTLVTDSLVVQSFYHDAYGADPVYIAYGSDVEPLPAGQFLQQFGLEREQYILFVGRIVPENCVHHLVEAFQGLETDMKCVIVGDAPYAKRYQAELRSLAGSNVIFTGYLFGEGYRELSTNAYCFVESSEVGGTHPALLEAMAFGKCVIVNDTAENLETIGDAGLSYDGREGAAALHRVLARLIRESETVAAYGERARRRVQRYYTWDTITDRYERLFYFLLEQEASLSKVQLP